MPTLSTTALIKQILLCHAADFDESTPAAATADNTLVAAWSGAPAVTVAELDLTSFADADYWQSDKFLVADANFELPSKIVVDACFELAATPTAGEAIYIYWAGSESATGSVGNPGGVVGANGAYDSYPTTGVAADGIKQLELIGVFTCEDMPTGNGDDAQIQLSIGEFTPTTPYGTVVVRNESGAAFHTVMDETHIVLKCYYDEAQTA